MLVLRCSGAGPLICSARGRSVLAVLGPPGLCLSRGRPDPGLCPGALCSRACVVGFALPPRSSLPGAAPEPLRTAPLAPPVVVLLVSPCAWDQAGPRGSRGLTG
ncbi:unnamed protein product [Nyctereutes procyonoides]|uniref:(raccoon dog) hypothetical protein n=1 Tax=Nyctereutes procyonoides TaxID=34880 RepID=A0A811XYZ1_NYCPR|nr:unnamed protein product [Nyctereutes procyonoides]